MPKVSESSVFSVVICDTELELQGNFNSIGMLLTNAVYISIVWCKDINY